MAGRTLVLLGGLTMTVVACGADSFRPPCTLTGPETVLSWADVPEPPLHWNELNNVEILADGGVVFRWLAKREDGSATAVVTLFGPDGVPRRRASFERTFELPEDIGHDELHHEDRLLWTGEGVVFLARRRRPLGTPSRPSPSFATFADSLLIQTVPIYGPRPPVVELPLAECAGEWCGADVVYEAYEGRIVVLYRQRINLSRRTYDYRRELAATTPWRFALLDLQGTLVDVGTLAARGDFELRRGVAWQRPVLLRHMGVLLLGSGRRWWSVGPDLVARAGPATVPWPQPLQDPSFVAHAVWDISVGGLWAAFRAGLETTNVLPVFVQQFSQDGRPLTLPAPIGVGTHLGQVARSGDFLAVIHQTACGTPADGNQEDLLVVVGADGRTLGAPLRLAELSYRWALAGTPDGWSLYSRGRSGLQHWRYTCDPEAGRGAAVLSEQLRRTAVSTHGPRPCPL